MCLRSPVVRSTEGLAQLAPVFRSPSDAETQPCLRMSRSAAREEGTGEGRRRQWVTYSSVGSAS
jgi:hypothetical protein